ncbi:MAG: SDR family NAD(P)-dependent oxidoreductase [Cellulosilyticaceae bacterium]
MYKDATILITGGTGSWGNELTKQLLEQEPKEIRIFSRGELAQVNMERNFLNHKLKFIIGDIRDKEAIEEATQGVDYVYHLAALKHVPVCEMQPQEAIKTNITGTINLVNACIKNKVKKVIDVSTDKAVAPLNLYGMTKGVGERLIIQANTLSEHTRFVCIRAGNVLGSNGSVVPFFIQQIEKYNKVTLTHQEMTRYFLTIPEAIGLLFKASEKSFGGEIFVMKMPACRILDLARVLINQYGNEQTEIVEIGMRPGEKMHEELISDYELPTTYEYNEDYYLIAPTLPIAGIREHYQDYKNMKKVVEHEASLKKNLMTEQQIKELLTRSECIIFDK